MKIEIHTIRFGSSDWMSRCTPTVDSWCKRHGMKLKVWDERIPKAKAYPNVKFVAVDMLKEFLAGDGDQMIYVDADVLVHPEAPRPSFGPGMHARCHHHRVDNPYWTPWCLEHFRTLPDGGGNYRNAGFWVVDRDAAKRLLDAIREPYIEGVMEQHHFNWWIMLAERDGLKVHDLDRIWHSFPKEWSPAWIHHAYGTNKMKVIRAIERFGLMKSRNRPQVKVATKPNSWPMFMDKEHLDMLSKLLAEKKPEVAMEIGSHHGVSTQVFLDALRKGHIKHLHIVEIDVTPELKARIWESSQKDKITIHTAPSWDVMKPVDFVLIDGHHGWPALADLSVALATKVPIIAMHDTHSKTAGIKECWGSEMAAQILSKAPGREWSCDNTARDGSFTQRGFGWSCLSQ